MALVHSGSGLVRTLKSYTMTTLPNFAKSF
jgi:hypothetical protein